MRTRWFSKRNSVLIGILGAAIPTLLVIPIGPPMSAENSEQLELSPRFTNQIQPLLNKYCLDCHSTKAKKGHLDLERFATTADIRKDLKPWQAMIEQLEAGEMPPKGKLQPTAEEKKQLLSWVRQFLDGEARTRAGDPGHVPLRRLSNAEFDATIRDLTGVNLRPTREFPADGAAGEGFTNAAEALSDVSPALLTKYLNAAKEVAQHAVLLPDGFRFSAGKTRRDWTDESTARLQRFYANVANGEGKLPIQAYLTATVRHRDALMSGKAGIDEIADKEQLSPKYLGELWKTLSNKTSSYPLDDIRARWRQAGEKDVPSLVAEITAWQNAVWKAVPVGSYKYSVGNGYAESTSRQMPNHPVLESQTIRLAFKPEPGQTEVVLHLASRELFPEKPSARVVWQRPRFEAPGKPVLLLKDYPTFGPAYSMDYPSIFRNAAKYLTAARELAHVQKKSVEDQARADGLDAAFLHRWVELLALKPIGPDADPDKFGRVVPLIAMQLLEEKIEKGSGKQSINGWRKKGTDLPSLVTNSSDTLQLIPGKAAPHSVLVHPMPKEFVAVVWKSPVAGSIRITARITDAHDACGNGVAWWLEHRRGERAAVFAEGAIDNGSEAKPPKKTLKIEKGDQIVLAIDAKNGDHVCDLTDIALTIVEVDKPSRTWDLAADIADSILEGNPHADKHDNRDTWAFARGPARTVDQAKPTIIAPGSTLAKWRDAAVDPTSKDDAAKLAEQVQALLSGPRPVKVKDPDRLLYDNLVTIDSRLFRGLDPIPLGKSTAKQTKLGPRKDLFGIDNDEANFPADAGGVIEIRLPAALFQGREFVVDVRSSNDRVVQFQASVADPKSLPVWDARPMIAGSPSEDGRKRLAQGFADFRRIFPMFVCFPRVIPTDEVVCLKMFHREDEPLLQLFLNEAQTKQIESLWKEHRFISRQAIAENAYLPQFIGFVTQDQPKQMVAYFEGMRPIFKQRADEFEKEQESAIPKHVDALHQFASKAFRRPLTDKETADLRNLDQALRNKGASHEEAFRGVLARILVSPAFLFRIEQATAGKDPGPVNDWELATRLSYFLWSSTPDEELRRLAAAGRLHDSKVLASQVDRMIQDARIRSLAIEFGTQWIHVRGFDTMKEKNEKLFPSFDAKLRVAIYEESILFIQDLFQSDRAVAQLLDADYTFLNETLAKHYGIPGVTGSSWRKVDGVKKYGRGGLLGLASVQAKEAGASRTSPVLRGNWVVETLLGEKLPRPPANVPMLPEEEGGSDKLTMRQLVEKHTSVVECAVCHQRIDPFGFALEKYDPIGRLREKDLGGLPLDAKAKLRDGTEFEGIDGLRAYLLGKKKDVVTRLFCRRLLGYALGRSVTLSDTVLLDEMVAELNKNDGRVTVAIQAIVRSPQFRMVRGSEFRD